PPSISQLPSFFLRSDFHHRSLHSFPTRRSSDLLTPAGAEGAACSVLCSCPGPSTRSPYVASRRLGQAASGRGISPAIWMIPENSRYPESVLTVKPGGLAPCGNAHGKLFDALADRVPRQGAGPLSREATPGPVTKLTGLHGPRRGDPDDRSACACIKVTATNCAVTTNIQPEQPPT